MKCDINYSHSQTIMIRKSQVEMATKKMYNREALFVGGDELQEVNQKFQLQRKEWLEKAS